MIAFVNSVKLKIVLLRNNNKLKVKMIVSYNLTVKNRYNFLIEIFVREILLISSSKLVIRLFNKKEILIVYILRYKFKKDKMDLWNFLANKNPLMSIIKVNKYANKSQKMI